MAEGYLPVERLEALRGLIFCLPSVAAGEAETWVARLQIPLRHLEEGSGQAVQYHPELYSPWRPQPLHCSTIV